MHKAVCSDCGEECEVPFEPTQGKPIYCNECWEKHKPPRR
jgi:CxxC-x17-CxxC domain-containing protein